MAAGTPPVLTLLIGILAGVLMAVSMALVSGLALGRLLRPERPRDGDAARAAPAH